MPEFFAVRHSDDDPMLEPAEHKFLQALANEVRVKCDVGLAGHSFLEMPADEHARATVESRLKDNAFAYRVVTRISY